MAFAGGIGWRAVQRLLSVLLIGLGLTACGKSSEDEYKEAFPPINRGLVVLGNDVGEGVRDAGETDDRALAGEFAGYSRRLGELRDRLDALEAPGGLAKDHDALLDATATVRRALRDVAEAARRGDAVAARDAATRLVRGGLRLDEARSELARAVREP
jgi:hypothetical protein